jgi:hypothetical protein
MTIIVDTRPSGKFKNGQRKKNKPNFPPNLYTKPKNLPRTNPKLRRTLLRMILNGLKKKIQEVA